MKNTVDDNIQPNHIAIIMDGNGRWAAERGLPRIFGHRKGVEAVRRTVKAVAQRGISYLTLYCFSSDNWSRPVNEVDDLMTLLRRYIKSDLVELNKSNVRIKCIGEKERIAKDILALMQDAVELTKSNDGLTLVVAINYGSRNEIIRAAIKLGQQMTEGKLRPSDITAENFSQFLDTQSLPDPDLVIRTSGEMRLSNFLLWQSAYSEFVFLKDYWPDFGESTLDEAINIYKSRDRRYGGLSKISKV